MARNGFKLIDSELHMQEPYDLWEKRLPDRYRSITKITRPPRGNLDTGHLGIDLAGKGWPVRMTSEQGPNPQDRGSLVFRQGNRRWKEAPDLARFRMNPSPEAWLEGMDMDGIDVAILTPTLGLHVMAIDEVEQGHAAALCRAYNDFVAEFASVNPDRFKIWGWLPRQAPELAAAEARRCVEELGAAGVAMTNGGVDRTVLTDTAFEPLWTEIERLGVPLGLHVFGQSTFADDLGHRYAGHPRTEVVSSIFRLPFYGQTALAEFILGGVLDAHPKLKVVIQEANVTWLPWLLWRMDEKWETYGPDQEYSLSLRPSDYFKRQCYAVIDADEQVARYAIDFAGDDNFLWSSDFPHHDATFPGASDMFLEIEGISEASKRKILWDNGAKLFGLEVPAGAR